MIKIFDSKSGVKVDFKSLNEGEVLMYVCGPTVYDYLHFGHARQALVFDLVFRYLKFCGFRVKYASNYTDIDDKMIDRAKLNGVSVSELAEKFIEVCEEDYKKLGISGEVIRPKATEYIEEMIEIIRLLEEKGFVYEIEDGVYFDTSKFSEYGNLSGQNLENLRSGERNRKADLKRNHQDFVLWKFKKEGEPFWASPWGDGRPGWHIECSAMVLKVLGKRIDIHGGGADLLFPHHECEKAQSEAAFGEVFVNYWMHNGFVNVDKVKMSKSLGNFFSLKEVFENYSGKVVRFIMLQTHYRSPIEFSEEVLVQAKGGLERIADFNRRITDEFGEGEVSDGVLKLVEGVRGDFLEGMNDDFDAEKGLTAWFKLIKEVNKLIDENAFSKAEKSLVIKLRDELNLVFGVLDFGLGDQVDDEVLGLIKERENAREVRNFNRADEIRDLLLKKGIVLEDTSSGTKFKSVF